ncbi:MAG: fimbrial assembly protein [Terracidiphilus sp.]
MRITLNLATRPFADLGPAIKRLRIAMAVLAVIAVGLGLGLRAFHQKADEARARDHSLDGQIARITRERQGYQEMMRQPANVLVVTQAEALNRLFDEKTFSWTLAMEDLETVLPGRVQASTLEPVRAKDGHITLHLRVIGPRDLAVELVRNLEHSKRFLLPRIVGENAESTEGPGKHLEPVSASDRVDFDLLADYNPASPGEHKTAKKPTPTREDSGSRTAPHTIPTPATPSHRPLAPYVGPDQRAAPATMNNRFKPNPSHSPAPGGPK